MGPSPREERSGRNYLTQTPKQHPTIDLFRPQNSPPTIFQKQSNLLGKQVFYQKRAHPPTTPLREVEEVKKAQFYEEKCYKKCLFCE